IDVFLGGILPDAARFFVFGQQRRKNTAGSDMILELESIADDFVDTEVQGDRPHLKIESAGHEYVAISQVARGLNQGVRLRKDGWFQRHFEKIVGQADEAIAMHSTIGAKGKAVEERARIEIQAEIHRHTGYDFRELINAA